MDLLKLIKFRTVKKYEENIHLKGAGYMTPPKKCFLHNREIFSVLYLRHFESLYHVMFFLLYQTVPNLSKFMFQPNINKLRTVRKDEKNIHLKGAGFMSPPQKIPLT